MKCPKCFVDCCVKNVFTYGKQRYKCKKCGCNFIQNRKKYNDQIKKDAIFLYIEGLGINAIAMFLKISQQIISYWIKKYANIIQQLKTNDQAECDLVEVDELCTFLNNEKIKNGYGLFTTTKKTKLLILKAKLAEPLKQL
jgi:transposase-like protein